MATFRTNVPDVFEARQQELIFKAFDMDTLLYTEVFNVKTSTKGHEDAFEMAGLGTFQLKPEGTPIAQSDPAQGPRRRVVHSTFALSYRVTMEALADAQHDVLDQMPSDLGDSARDHQENLAWGVINSGTGTGTHTGMDGLAFFTASHTTVKGGTVQSNLLSPAVALSTTGLEEAIINLRTTKSEEERQIGQGLAPAQLLIHPDLEPTAWNLLEAVGRPGVTDNDRNSIARHGLKIISIPFLTDTNAFTIATDKRKHKLVWYNRAELTTDSGVDMATKDRIFDGFYRASLAIRGWRGFVHSAG